MLKISTSESIFENSDTINLGFGNVDDYLQMLNKIIDDNKFDLIHCYSSDDMLKHSIFKIPEKNLLVHHGDSVIMAICLIPKITINKVSSMLFMLSNFTNEIMEVETVKTVKTMEGPIIFKKKFSIGSFEQKSFPILEKQNKQINIFVQENETEQKYSFNMNRENVDKVNASCFTFNIYIRL